MTTIICLLGVLMFIIPYTWNDNLTSVEGYLMIIYGMLVFIAMGIFWIVEILREIRNK